MTSSEAAAARERLGFSVEDLAAEVALTPDVVHAWEQGSVSVPAKVEKELRWWIALLDRQDALVESGLPDCSWRAAFDDEEIPEDAKATIKHFERAEEHHKSCSVCQAREQFVAERFGKMPSLPVSDQTAVLVWIGDRVQKLPDWARPAVWGALAFGTYSMLRVIFWIPAILRDPRQAVTALVGLSASMAIGTSLGLLYGGFQHVKKTWINRDRQS